MMYKIRPAISSVFFTATLAISSCFLVGSAQAQDADTDTSAEGKSIYFGAKAGITLSQFSRTQPHITEKIGLTGGIFAEYAFSDKFSVRVEGNYLQQGSRLVRFSDNTRFGDFSEFAVFTTDNHFTTHNVDIPVLAKYKFLSLGAMNLSLLVGPSIGINIGATSNFERTYHNSQTFLTVSGFEDISSEFERLYYNAVGGVTGEINAGGKTYFVDLRYYYGITPAKKGYSYVDLFDVQGDLTSYSIALSFGYKF